MGVSLANAQIVPDATLPRNSVVTTSDRTAIVEGGTTAGGNLFHSFREFSIPTGSEAFFNNALDIQNIITRVTGGQVSSIDGTIRSNGSANLFFINPSGIIFGPNAKLNIGGSFIGSTANSLRFADGSEFSATNLQAPPLLSINVPTGLQFSSNPGSIKVQNTGHTLNIANPFFPLLSRGNENGLRLQPGKTLALVGGDIVLQGGILAADAIELGSVDTGLVTLNPTATGWKLDYSGIENFRDLNLSARAFADASNSVRIQGRSLFINDGSVVAIENFAIQPSGEITVTTSASVELNGATSDGLLASSLISNAVGINNGSNITISTRRLTLNEGGAIFARTFSSATGGNVTVNALEAVEALGAYAFGFIPVSTINVTTYGSGNSGNVAISTRRLTILDGGIVGTASYGIGNGGDVRVNATDSIELTGVQSNTFTPSTVGAVTFGFGNAGSLTITTSRLIVRDGGRVASSTFTVGNAGSVAINASESIEVSGTVPGSINPSGIDSSALIVDERVRQLLRLPPVPSGESGNVTIETGRLIVENGGLVSVRNDGSGRGGLLTVNAGSTLVSTTGGITAATASGEGGNINLRSDNLQLRDRGTITATAGGTGNGGNITLDANTLAALGNSDITANSVASQGGLVIINARGLFGTRFRSELTPESDITATGGTPELSGTVEISSLDFDPSAAIVELPETFSDANTEIVAGCAANRNNRFVVTGRGGLPADPDRTLRGQAVWQDVRFLGGGSSVMSSGREFDRRSIINDERSPTIEATGWKIDTDGRVQLIANASDEKLQSAWNRPTHCGN